MDMELIRKEKPISRSSTSARLWTVASAIAASLCFFSSAWALGVGSLKTESALNQPLAGKIEILGVQGNELDSLTVEIAPEAVYERMGIERHEALDKLRFEIVKDASQPHIRVTTDEPVGEPFLNFLIEINWASGRLLREFTALLDPVTTTDEKPQAVESAQTGAPPEIVAPTTKTELEEMPSTPLVTHVQEAKPVEAGRAVEYGPVKRGENLWKIAEAIRPSNVTVEQVMLTLLKQNPDAFFGNNISMLKAGAVLRVEKDTDFMQIPIDKAVAEVSKHHQQWLAYRREKMAQRAVAAESASKKPLGSRAADGKKAAGTAESRLELVTPTAEEIAKAEVGNIAIDSKSKQSSGDMRVELAMTNEALEAARKENQDLKGRISNLETQLSSMQSLLELKDNQFAKMQGETVANGETAGAMSKIDMLEGAPESQEEPVVAEGEPNRNLWRDPVTIGTIVGALSLLGVGFWLFRSKLSARNKMSTTAFDNTASGERSRAAPVDDLDLDTDDSLANRPSSTASEIELLEPIELPVEESVDEMPREYSLAESTRSQQVAMQDEMIDVLSKPISTTSRFDSGIDAMAEADVYIAYGKYTKAEEALAQAIAQDPDRQELKLKLLEVFALSGKSDSFVEKAEELYAALHGDKTHSIWHHVIQLAEELGVKGPLFEGSAASISTPASEFASATLELLEPTPISTPVELPEVSDILSRGTTTVSRGDRLSTPVSTAVEPAAFEALEDVGRQDWQPEQVTDIVQTDRPLPPDTEFEPKDLPGFSTAAVSNFDESKNFADIEKNELIALADTFAEEELRRESTPSVSKPLLPDVSSEAFVNELFGEAQLSEQDRYVDTVREETEMYDQEQERQSAMASKPFAGSMASQAVSAETFKQEPAPEAVKPVAETDTLSLAAKKMSEAVLGKEKVETESSFFLLDDEVDTKLDLARAYIEMGDKAGAVDLLKEVEEEGDVRQKREAGDLLVLTR